MDSSSQKRCVSSLEHLCVCCTARHIAHLWLRLYANTAAACQRKSHSQSHVDNPVYRTAGTCSRCWFSAYKIDKWADVGENFRCAYCSRNIRVVTICAQVMEFQILYYLFIYLFTLSAIIRTFYVTGPMSSSVFLSSLEKMNYSFCQCSSSSRLTIWRMHRNWHPPPTICALQQKLRVFMKSHNSTLSEKKCNANIIIKSLNLYRQKSNTSMTLNHVGPSQGVKIGD